MKKLIALLMAAVMLLSACSALADTTKVVLDFDESMNITMLLPEGYQADSTVVSGVMMASVMKDDESLNMTMVICADADYDEAERLNDLTEDEKKALAADFCEDLDNEPWSIMTSGYGTEAIVIDEADGGYDMLIVASLYHGYDIVMYLGYTDGRKLTEADVAQAMQLFTDLQFETKVPAAE